MAKKLEQKFKGEGIPTTAKVSPLQARWRASESPLTPHATRGTLGIGSRHRVVETTSPCFCRKESPHLFRGLLCGEAQALQHWEPDFPGVPCRGRRQPTCLPTVLLGAWPSTSASPALPRPCSPLGRVRKESQEPGSWAAERPGILAWGAQFSCRERREHTVKAVSDWLKPSFCPAQAGTGHLLCWAWLSFPSYRPPLRL